MQRLIGHIAVLTILDPDKTVTNFLADHFDNISLDQGKIRAVPLGWSVVEERRAFDHDNHPWSIGRVVLHGGATLKKESACQKQKSKGLFHRGRRMLILHGEGIIAKPVVENRCPVAHCDEIVTLSRRYT